MCKTYQILLKPNSIQNRIAGKLKYQQPSQVFTLQIEIASIYTTLRASTIKIISNHRKILSAAEGRFFRQTCDSPGK